jgi:hypothetical protein
VTRSGSGRGTEQGISELFATNVDAAVLRVLRDSGTALVKSEILDQLATAGVPRSAANDAWGPAQKRLRTDKRVIAEGDRHSLRYRWNPNRPAAPSPADALAMLVERRLTRGERAALAETLLTALADTDGAAVRAQETTARPVKPARAEPPVAQPSVADGLVSANRLRQVELDAARELAGMAIDVEEQLAKGASAKAITHRVRARMKRLRLEPIEKAGEAVPFDRVRHQPMRPGIVDGAIVLVIRPGYVWRTPGDDLLIERPVVQD